MGYGAGLIGLIAIKVLAPGYYATQDIRTPVRIAIMVLVFTQLMNIVLVPLFAHAGLTLAISLGALVNASALLWGLIRRGRYTPSPGWTVFVLRVVAATALLSVFLMWSAGQVQWVGASVREVPRMLSLGLIMLVSAALYFGALWGTGLKLREFARR